jgi:hypothetical protein
MSVSQVVKYLLTLTVFLTVAAATSEVFACPRTPSQLLKDLKAAVENVAPPSTGWRTCLSPDFKEWKDGPGGSQNLAFIAAAVGLYRNPHALMPYPNGTTSGITYVNWWLQLLASQTGAQPPPAGTGKLGYFRGTEVFSNIYDGPVVTTVVAVRYWAVTRGHGQLNTHARKYLRANWAVNGLAAGTGPASVYFLPGRTPSAAPLPDTQYNPNAPRRNDGDYWYSGHFLALPGARSNLGHWVGDDRLPLFDRAIQHVPRRTNESFDQKELLSVLERAWTNPDENLYALTRNDIIALNALITNGSGASNFLPWLSGIRWAKTFRIIGWPNFRASSMEGNPNGNTTCMYAVSYDGAAQRASFLFPWGDEDGDPKHGGHPEGWSALRSPGAMEASNYPGHTFHPLKTVSMPLPQTAPLFHIVLSPSMEPFNEVTPPSAFPPFEPPDIPIPLL